MAIDQKYYSCIEIISGLRKKEFSSLEITEHFLQKISTNEKLNAAAFINEEDVRQAARDADVRLAKGDRAPLLGLPLSIKDSIAVKNWPWRSGSFARENVIAQEDATAVARLRAAGAHFLCKTTVPEYTWSVETESAITGRTDNPFDTERTSGGSSGGEAVLHAVGGAPAGLGSDGLNSIRVPAHYCGTAGLRPTAGIVPETGAWPTTRTSGLMDISTIGPMARSAADLAMLITTIEGYDGIDPFAHTLGNQKAFEKYDEVNIGYFLSHPIAPASDDTQTAVKLAAGVLKALGAKTQEISPWPIEQSVSLAFRLMAPDGGKQVRADVAAAQGRHSQSFAVLIEQLRSQKLDIDEYLNAVSEFKAFRSLLRSAFNKFDAIILPVAADSAPRHLASLASDESGLSIDEYSYSFAVALAGLPSVAVPVLKDRTGLPTGVQIVCKPHFDLVAIDFATKIQEALNSFFLI